MLRELDIYEAKYQAERRGRVIDACETAFHRIYNLLNVESEPVFRCTLEDVLDYLDENFDPSELQDIAEAILLVSMC